MVDITKYPKAWEEARKLVQEYKDGTLPSLQPLVWPDNWKDVDPLDIRKDWMRQYLQDPNIDSCDCPKCRKERL